MPNRLLGIQLPTAEAPQPEINCPALPQPGQLPRPPALLLKTSLDVIPPRRSRAAKGRGRLPGDKGLVPPASPGCLASWELEGTDAPKEMESRLMVAHGQLG